MTKFNLRRAAPLGKLAVPRLGRVFDRARLFQVLYGFADYPAIWIAAPPGAGKTTLTATWLKQCVQPPLWLQLDNGDADPATFIHALDTLMRGGATSAIDLPAFQADDLSDLTGCLRRRVRAFLERSAAPWTLVFDNFQELPADSPLQAALAKALTELPAGVQWLFLSRQGPTAAFARALSAQQVAVLEAEQLRFDELETGALVRLHGRPETMTSVLAAANGWAAGMTLMLQGSPHDARLASLKARQHLFDYFADEVLALMPPAEQHALCAIAFLPGASAELAIAMSGYEDAGKLLERLSASSLFTDRREATAPGASAAYVFHALFSEFLRRRLERTASAAELQALRARAGTLMLEAGEIDAGLAQLIEAQQWHEAQTWLVRCAPQYAAQGRTQALRQFIDALPPEHRADLAYWRGFCALNSTPADALPDLDSAYLRYVAAADVDGQLMTAAAAATALVATGQVMRLDRWIEVLDQHADRLAIVRDEDTEMRLVPGLFAALVYRAPWHPQAESLAARAERLLHLESAPGQRLLLGSIAFHLLWLGHIDRLERVVLRVDALCSQRRAPPATMIRWWSVGILVKILTGRLAAARLDIDQALALVESEPSVVGQRASVELLAMLAALGDADAPLARQHMLRAGSALHPDNAVDRTTYEHQRGVLALLEGDQPAALRSMRAAVASAADSGFAMREHVALIANALAAANGDAHEEAGLVLQRVFAHPFHQLPGWHHWVAGCVAAYAAIRRDDVAEAISRFGVALRVARDCGFRHGPMLFCCTDLMPRLTALALARDVEPDIARDIVIRNDLTAPAEAEESWPWAVRLHALGRLEVERADGPIPASRKASRRLVELLGLLIAQGETPVAQDRIADELWPDSDGDAARNALDNALHRLRKMLGGDDRVLLRQGALLLNPARCWSDVVALERLLTELESAAHRADGSGRSGGSSKPLPLNKRAAELVRTITQLYRAPLLPDETLPGVISRRAVLHQRVRSAFARAGESLPDL